MALTIPPTCFNLVFCIYVMNQQEPQIKKMESLTLHSPAPLFGFQIFCVLTHNRAESEHKFVVGFVVGFVMGFVMGFVVGQLFLNGPLHFC